MRKLRQKIMIFRKVHSLKIDIIAFLVLYAVVMYFNFSFTAFFQIISVFLLLRILKKY